MDPWAKTVFRDDLDSLRCSTSATLLTHEGPALQAQRKPHGTGAREDLFFSLDGT